jgi:hypothetical protein
VSHEELTEQAEKHKVGCPGAETESLAGERHRQSNGG